MTLALTVLLILSCGALDLIRGSEMNHNIRFGATTLYGAVVFLLAGANIPWLALAAGLLWGLGERPGWGSPMGAVLRGGRQFTTERWQTPWLTLHPSVSLAVRGLAWGAPLGVLGFIHPGLFLVPVAMAAAFPASALISFWLCAGSWRAAEVIRGSLCAALVAAGQAL